MDRNREARRATNMAAPPNGLSSSRRRHRTTRDSPDEDGGGMEIQERLRDRGGVVKKDRDRDRERERSIRSKRRRENRLIHQNQNQNHNQNHHRENRDRDRDRDRDDGDDTSEESVNDEEGEDEDDVGGGGNGGSVRMLPPPPSNSISNNHHHSQNSNSHAHQNQNQHPQQQQLHHRKTFPPSANNNNNKVFRSAPTAPPPQPPPAWKATADEMIGVSVPRKARSASTKRSHEWISGGGGGGGGGHEQINRQLSTSPVNLAASPASLAAPPSPSSSSISVRKKMKAANGGGGGGGGGSKPRPPKSSSKSSSSNPEELEIEIAEVLYGLMTQSQAAPSKKENDSNNKSSSDNNKSRVSSPISNSTNPVQNSTSLSTVAPKRKRPRQVSENPFSRSSSVSPSIKNEIDHQHQHHQSPKTDLEENSQVSAAAATGDNCVPFGFTSLPSDPPMQKAEQDGKCGVDVGLVLTKQEVEKKSHAVGLNDGNKITQTVITTPTSMTTTNIKAANPEITSQKEEKFEIDLMAPPPQQRTSPERDEDLVAFSDHKQMATQEASKNKEEEKLRKISKEETMNLIEEQKKSKTGSVQESGESLSKQQVMNEDRNIGLHIDLEKPNKDTASVVSGSSNRSLHQALKHQQLSAKPETHTEKTAQPSSMQMPMSVANWPPMGYVSPLQGVISMDGNTMPSAPVQPIFTHPRPKRCATHCYIARNIHYLQQFMKINPFWPAASGAAPMFGAKPCGLNVAELGHGNIPQATQDKGHVVNMFPGHPAGKDNKSSQGTTIPDSAQRKQQVLLQQALPPVTPNNILHGPAFIFPFNQQQAVAAASASASASVRPGSSKVNNNTSTAGAVGLGPGASGSANSATVGASATAAAPALSFNYPNMSANETQYLAILQNNPYTFPIPAVGAPPNYRGNPHGQPMPMFNGSFYSSQMIHPSQIPQPPQQQAQPSQSQSHHPSQSQQISQTHQNSSGSTSSSQRQQQQQQQQQQRQQQQQGSVVAVNGGGSMHNSYPVPHKSRSQASQHMNPPPPQARHLENEVTGGEDSPSTADSRVSRAANTMSVYGHNFAMPVHSQNFALMNPQAAMSNATASGNSNDKKHQQQSQQQGSKRSLESSSLPPQTFAMSFAPMNGTTGAMAQNHAIFQTLPESLRQSYQHMIQTAPASAHHSQQKKDFRVSEETSRTINHDSSNAEEDRKGSSGMTGKSGQSIAFSRPDLSTDVSGSSSAILGTSVIDSSSRNINLGSNNNRSSRSPISTSVAAGQSSHHHLHAQFQQQQQVLQLQKQQQQQQQQNMNARSKNPVSNNGSPYPDHLMTSSSSMAAAKFPNSLSSFPQNLVQTGNTTTSPGQSPQWRNSVRGGPATSQVPSSLSSATTSSLKNLHQSHQAQQQQSSRPHPQSHTQISFGTAGQKLQSTTSLQMQQQQNQNLGSNSSNQSPSPPMLVGSPTTSSISKGGGGGGSPRTNAGSASTSGRAGQASSLSSSQQAKNSPVGTQRSSPSILGNPHNPNSNKSQQQLPKQTIQQQQAQAQAQAHMFFAHPYMQVQQPQAQQHSGGAATTSGYYLPRKQQQLQQSSQPQQSSSSTSSTAMLSLCPPVTLANTSTTTSDPAKAIAAATSNLKGGVGQGILHAAQYGGATQSSMPAGFPQYNAHNNAPASVQVKPTEQKQPAGNDTLRTWQPEKK